MDFLDDENDKLITTTPCELVRNGRHIRGKLFLFGKRLTFCSILAYSSLIKSQPDPKRHMFTLRSLIFLKPIVHQIESVQLFGDGIHVNSKRQVLSIFRNTQQNPKEIFKIISTNLAQWGDNVDQESEAYSQFNEVEEQQNILSISAVSSKGTHSWFQYRKKVEPYVQQLLQLKKDHSYGKPQTILLQDVSIADVYSTIFTDKPYKPSIHMRLGRKDQLDFQNPFHYLMEQIVGDRNLQATLWSPQVPQYFSSANRDHVPQSTSIHDLPQRTIVMDHPTKIPFFGEVCPQVTLTQRLLLVDDKEFWIFVTTDIVKMVYCENYKMKGYYKIQEVKDREYYIETRECVEWNRKLLIVSGQVDQAAAKENERMFNNYVIPFMNQRRDEIINSRENAVESQQVTKQSRSSPAIVKQNSVRQSSIPEPQSRDFIQSKEILEEIKILKASILHLESRLDHTMNKLTSSNWIQLRLLFVCLIMLCLCIAVT